MVDLPALDFHKMLGGPVLRLLIGVLKKMTEGLEDEFSEALWPLLEVGDPNKKLEFTKEIIEFVGKVMAAHNKKIDEKKLRESLKPILADEGEYMIKTIFEEKYDEGYLAGEARGEARGEAIGEAKGKVNSILRKLNNRFEKVPKRVIEKLNAINDLEKLDELTDLAYECVSLNEFKMGLK